MNSSTTSTYSQVLYETVAWFMWPIQWILFNLFCCFLFYNKDHNSQDYDVMAKIKKNLKHLKKKKINEDLRSIFALVQLLKKDTNAIKFLEKMRINPKINKTTSSKRQSTKLRSDLEFFLPQILSHYLREDLTDNEENTISKLIT
jgi:hypothetical protein